MESCHGRLQSRFKVTRSCLFLRRQLGAGSADVGRVAPSGEFLVGLIFIADLAVVPLPFHIRSLSSPPVGAALFFPLIVVHRTAVVKHTRLAVLRPHFGIYKKFTEFLSTFSFERCVLKRRNNQGSTGQEKKFIQYLLLKGCWGSWRNAVFIPRGTRSRPWTGQQRDCLRCLDCQGSVVPQLVNHIT